MRRSWSACDLKKRERDLLRLNFQKSLDNKIDMHIITVRSKFSEKNTANMEVDKRPIWIKTELKIAREIV
jgi:hypothetical protein